MHSFKMTLVLALLAICWAGPAQSDMSRMVNVQGLMSTSGGTPVVGTYDLEFRIYPVASGGSAVWAGTTPDVVVAGGVFEAVLGPLPVAPIETTSPLWLETRVGADVLPRQPVYPVVHALYAQTAGLARGLDCTGCVQSGALSTEVQSLLQSGVQATLDVVQLEDQLATLSSELWCLKNCDPQKLGDCHDRTCEGDTKKCLDAGALSDGAACAGGTGRCLGGGCCVPQSCLLGGVQCGALADGCGAVLFCGECAAGAECVENRCCVALAFNDTVEHPFNTLVMSNIVTVSGISGSAPVTVSGAGNPQLKVGAGSWGATGTISNGQTLQLRQTAASSGLVATSAVVKIGVCPTTWTVTTKEFADCTLPWGGILTHGLSVTAYAAASVPFGNTCASQVRTCTNGVLSGTYTAEACTVAAPVNCTLPWGGPIAHGQSVTAYAAASVPFGGTCASQVRTCSNGTLSGSYAAQSCSVGAPAACSLPWGGSVGHGGSVTAYAAASVPCGSSCASQTRTCSNGSLSGSYPAQSCSVADCGGGGANLLNGVNTGGTAVVKEVSGYGGATVWSSGDLSANCSASWMPQGTLCDEAPNTHSKVTSTKSNQHSGATWNVGGGTGTMVIDLGAIRTFDELRVFQMFSDGKTTGVRFAIHSSTSGSHPTWSDGGWQTITGFQAVSAGAQQGNDVTSPTVIAVGSRTTRYLRVEAQNSGAHGSPSYIELRSIKMFSASGGSGACTGGSCPNLLKGSFSGGAAVVKEVAAYGGAAVYSSGDLSADCGANWMPQGTLCDESPYADSRDYSAKSNTHSGATWNTGGGTGTMVIDLGSAKTFGELRVFQMFSDGKTTAVRFAIHPTTSGSYPSWSDGGWQTLGGFGAVSAGVQQGTYVTSPSVFSVGTNTTRYLRVEAQNSGAYSFPSYIEIRSIKMF